MKLTIDTDYCPVRNFDDVCSLCNCECISGEALTRDCPLIRNGGTPYNLTGDCISREALRKHAIWTKVNNGAELIDIEVVPLVAIDKAPTVPTFTLEDMQNNWDDGAAHEAAKHDRPQGEWKHITIEGNRGEVPTITYKIRELIVPEDSEGKY